MTDDAINRQQAIATAVSAAIDWHRLSNPQYSIAYSIGEALRALPSAQQWIPCSERLPEENKAILLGVKYKDDFKMFVTARMDITYWQGLGRDIKCQEMRWMPLPEPWKGEDDE